MFKVNNRNTRTRCEICSKLTIKKVERCQQVNAGWVNLSGYNAEFQMISHSINKTRGSSALSNCHHFKTNFNIDNP